MKIFVKCGITLLVFVDVVYGGYTTTYTGVKYVEYQVPNPGEALNVMLSAPHGGLTTTEDLPDRQGGCLNNGQCVWRWDCPVKSRECRVTTAYDTRTQEIVKRIANTLEDLTGKRPYVVICKLKRTKVDMNREIGEATLGFPATVQAYMDYHSYLAQARNAIEAAGLGKALVLDIHAVASHPRKWIELGYRIPIDQLNNGAYDADTSSIGHLGNQVCPNDVSCFKQLIYGPTSFGGLLEKQGFTKVVPSPTNTSPGQDKYFIGGYITQSQGSLETKNGNAIQIELPAELRGRDVYMNTADRLAAAIKEYLSTHFGQ